MRKPGGKLQVDEVANMEVDKVADMVVDMKVGKVADIVADMEVNEVAGMSCSNLVRELITGVVLLGPFSTCSLPYGLRIF